MARIRPPKNPMPSAGGKPTGIFSTRGRQKSDPCTSKYKGMTGNNFDDARVKPVKRDNRIK